MDMAGDITLGSRTSYWGTNLTLAVQNGQVPESRLTDMGEYFVIIEYHDI